MIVCTNCGNHNENDDEFCGSCGKFLEWVGERVEAPKAAVVDVEPEPEAAARVGLVDRVKAAVGIDDHPGDEAPPVEEVPVGPTDEELAAAAAAAAEQSRLEGEAAEAARRAAQAEVEARQRADDQREADAAAEAARRAEDEAKAKVAEEAAAARRAEEEARRRLEDQTRASAEAERRREAEAEAARRAVAEAAAVAAAEAQVVAAQESARRAQEAADLEALDAAAQEAAEAEATRQAAEAQQAADALAAARRAEEAAREQAESEARARAEAETKEREEIEARRRAEDEARRRGEEEAKARAEADARSREQEEARLRAEDETRARIAAEARAKEEEEARRRAAALLARPKASPTIAADTPPPAADVFTPTASAAMTPTAAAQRPVAQQPSTVKAPPRPEPKAKPQEKVLKAGDLICDQCNEGNDPTRKFCRKCGNSLAKSEPVKKLPWWKTLFSGKKGAKVSKEAKGGKGARAQANEAKYKTQRLMAKVRFIFMGIFLLSLLGVNVAMPNLRGEVVKKVRGGLSSVQGSINPKFQTVNAVAVAATSAVPGHEPDFANDLVINSFWAEAAEGDGVGQTISFTFEAASDLTKVLITGGSTDTPENYLNHPRPKELHLVFDNGGSADVTLEDEFRKSQSFTLKGAKGVTKVDVVVSSVYKGRAGLDSAIAEIEFKKKG